MIKAGEIKQGIGGGVGGKWCYESKALFGLLDERKLSALANDQSERNQKNTSQT